MSNALLYETKASLPSVILAWGSLSLIAGMPNLSLSSETLAAMPVVYTAYRYTPGNAASTTMALFTGDIVVDHYRPRTELGRKLIALRRAYVEAGGKLLRNDEITEEMRNRRGGVVDAEA